MFKTAMTLMVSIAATVISFSSATAEELTWRDDIEPMIAAKCGACHGSDKPTYGEWRLLSDEDRARVGSRMDSYDHFMSYVIWPATGAMQRRLDDGTNLGGQPGNMYVFLGATDEERAENLKMLSDWLGAWNLNRWTARDDVPGVTKEQLEAIIAQF
ncbi:MAG: hypothetical protein ACK4RZ_09730 [Paracoccaceae bacterium]